MEKISAKSGNAALRDRMRTLSATWIRNGLPARTILEQSATELHQWKTEQAINGLWPQPPVMLTATLDDASGLGLDLIELYGRLAGVRIRRLGLVLQPPIIVKICDRERPNWLGLTVLQVDSEKSLTEVRRGLPAETRLIAGGPAFRVDPDLAETCGVFFMARNVAWFIDFLLNWDPAAK